jgi:hypothetical protein
MRKSIPTELASTYEGKVGWNCSGVQCPTRDEQKCKYDEGGLISADPGLGN